MIPVLGKTTDRRVNYRVLGCLGLARLLTGGFSPSHNVSVSLSHKNIALVPVLMRGIVQIMVLGLASC